MEKRQLFERQRQQERAETRKKSQQKQEYMKKIFEESARIQDQRKNQVLASVARAERRLSVREEEQRQSMLQKQQQQRERQKYLEKV